VGRRIGWVGRAGLIAVVAVGSVFAPLAMGGSLALASQPSGQTDEIAGPGGSSDPFSCIEPLAIPQIDNAIEQAWAPDSTHLAYTRIVPSTSRRTVTGYEEDPWLGILDVATGQATSLGPGSLPQWSASGTYLSFWRDGRLYIERGGKIVADIDASTPTVRWVGDQLVYFQWNEIHGWTAAADATIATVSAQYIPHYPLDWVDWSGDGQLFTLTRYHSDGSAERYVGETRTGQLAPLVTPGTTFTQWSPTGQTLLVRSNDTLELRGAGGSDAIAPLSKFSGPVHGWSGDGKALLVGKVAPTLPAGPSFDRFAVWDGKAIVATATLPNLLGTRAFSPDGRYFAGVSRSGLYETALEVYRCGSRATTAPSRADPVSRSRQQRIDADSRRFVRPVIGYFSQFLQGAHTGIDVAAPFGSLITADDEGEVTYVGWAPVGGRAVCVLHDKGIESCFYHTSLALVTKGQRVQRGEPVAAIGMTGLTSGPHVHWEVKSSGRIIDPLKQ
jgi:murein DD-endopeptidase MepM/ murein hydrolase activator NlpD